MRAALFAALLVAPLIAASQPQLAATLVGKSVVAVKGPLKGHPIQGFSSVNARPDGTYWVLGDTGHGAKAHREDLQVMFHHLYIDWRAGKANLLSAQALRDPGRKLPFRIARHASAERLLTTADVNVDAMQVLGDTAWFADDLGPYLIESDLRGRVLGAYPALLDGRAVSAAAVRRGFGGLAASRDRRLLYAAFEGALWSETPARWEASAQGREYVRILEFDVQARQWTRRALRYALEANGHTIGDLTLIDARTALVVERGPQFRRIYRVTLEDAEARKSGFVDLLAVNMATVEGLDIIDPGYLVLSNADRREFVLLRSPELLLPSPELRAP